MPDCLCPTCTVFDDCAKKAKESKYCGTQKSKCTPKTGNCVCDTCKVPHPKAKKFCKR